MAVDSPTSPVLAVLVCHDGETWLPETLAALRALRRRPRWVVAVDTGSTDATANLLTQSNEVDVVLPMARDTGFAEAVHAAVADADRRWGRAADAAPAGRDPANSSGEWLWVLHDDSAPEPDCLDVLLRVAETSPAAAVLGPLCLDWDDPRLVVEAGLSIDASGNRQTGIGADELDLGQFATNSEVLAVGSAGSLARRREWDSLGGFDTAMGLLREDTDYGWRVNRAGGLVLCAPTARIRHARAVATRRRGLDAAGTDARYRATDRAQGLRTFLSNCSTPAAVLGAVRLPLLGMLRALGLLLARQPRAASAELGALVSVLLDSAGRADLLDARSRRRAASSALPRELRGLLTSRTTRLRNAVRGGLTSVVRGRLRDELDLGRVPDWAARSASPGAAADDGTEDRAGARRVGPEALPAGALPRTSAGGRSTRRTAGLRRPGDAVAVALAAGATTATGVDPDADPDADPDSVATTPIRMPGGPGQVVVVPITAGRVARELLLAPPLLLVLGLTAVSLLVQRGRLGMSLAGGRIAEVGSLGQVWASYVAEWHALAGGTAAPAPVTLAVVGVLGLLAWPVGGPPAAVSLLLLAALPLAGLTAYLATRALRVGRVVRALAASVYALLGIATGAVAQGRLDAVVAVILLPLVLAGVTTILRGVGTRADRPGASGASGAEAPGSEASDRLTGPDGPDGPGPRGRGGVRFQDEGERTGSWWGGSWWGTAAGTALALALVSAFAPLALVLVLVVVLVGFVAVPTPQGSSRRRAASLAVVVLLPVLLLMPWPVVLLSSPEILLHGTGSPVAEEPVGVLSMLSLDPGGAGTVAWAGLVLIAFAVGAGFVAPRRSALPGLALIVLGIVAAGVVGSVSAIPLSGGDARPGWTGPALALAACGALWSLLAQVEASRVDPVGTLVGRPGREPRAPALRGESELDLGGAGVAGRVAAVADRLGSAAAGAGSRLARRRGAHSQARAVAVPALALATAVLVVTAVVGGTGGPLVSEPRPVLAPELAVGLVNAGATVVVVGSGAGATADGTAEGAADGTADEARRALWTLPRYGDDDLAPVAAAPTRLRRDVAALVSGEPAIVQAAVAELVTAGTGAIVLPDDATAEGVRAAAGPLLLDAGRTSDDRPVVRPGIPVGGAVVLEPPISDNATDGAAAPRRAEGITAVGAQLPTVALQVSPGADRRLLVLAAEVESGWSATVGGAPAPIVAAWGHLVGVPIPASGGPVVVDRDDTLRTVLLLLQLALVLFTAISALPARARRE